MEKEKNTEKQHHKKARKEIYVAASVREQRLIEEFSALIAIDSVSLCERAMADVLTKKLQEIGFTVSEDDAAQSSGGSAGNLYGYLPGTLPGDPILFSAHMDTVTPGIGKQALLLADGRITSAGDTVLGGDDVCGLLEILEGVRLAKESGKPYRSVEVLFPVAEELYGIGAAAFDYRRLLSKEAYTLDLSGHVGTAALLAPSIVSFTLEVTGKAAHAGFAPEKGIHAITALSDILCHLPQGHVDADTTCNIGKIQGGEATNIVPEHALAEGEIRSYHHARVFALLDGIKEKAETIAASYGASVSLSFTTHLQAYEISEDAPVVRRFQKACETIGVRSQLTSTFGGSDNNHFVQHGLSGIVLSCGMHQVHSTKEETFVSDLLAGANLVEALLTIE